MFIDESYSNLILGVCSLENAFGITNNDYSVKLDELRYFSPQMITEDPKKRHFTPKDDSWFVSSFLFEILPFHLSPSLFLSHLNPGRSDAYCLKYFKTSRLFLEPHMRK